MKLLAFTVPREQIYFLFTIYFPKSLKYMGGSCSRSPLGSTWIPQEGEENNPMATLGQSEQLAQQFWNLIFP